MTNRTKAIIGLGSVFILGGLCGALIFGVVIRNRVNEAQRLRDQDGFINYFEKRLELSEAQRDSLHDELAAAYEQLADLRFNASVSYNVVIDSLRSHIYPHLTPEQRELFNMQEQKFRRFMPREQMHGRGPHPPPDRQRPPAMAPETPPTSQAVPPAASKPAPSIAAVPRAAAPPAAAVDTARNADVSLEERMLNAMESRFQRVKQRLSFTAEQEKSVRQIIADARDRIRQAWIDNADQPVMRRIAIRDISKSAQRKINALLTDEQRQEMQKLRDESRLRKHGGPGETGRDGGK